MFVLLYGQIFTETSGGSQWQTKTSARMRFVRARHSPAASIAVLHVKARATQSNSIATVATKSAAATSSFDLGELLEANVRLA